MTPSFEKLQSILKRQPGLGYRSAERLALHLLVEKPEELDELVAALKEAAGKVRQCATCGNLAEADVCSICADTNRSPESICVVETVPDLVALERSGAFRGTYHILHGKLSPLRDVEPENLNLQKLAERLEAQPVEELILALSNDIEGESTCHFIQEEIVGGRPIKVSRIGFGIPSGGDLVYADAVTLKSALEGRRSFS